MHDRLPRLRGEADDLDFFADLDHAALDTAGGHGAAAFDREHVFDGHQEGLVDFARRLGNIGVDGVHQLADALGGCRVGGVVVGRQGAAADDGNLVAGETVLREQLAEFQLHQLQQLRVVDQVDLVEEHDQGGHVHLAGQEHVLAGLRHGAVGGRDDEDRPVHLGGPGDHVLDEVGVARAVDVGVVPLLGLVLDVRHGDGHGLGRVADRAALGDIGVRLELGQPFGGLGRQDGAGQRGLAVVNVADGAHVDVRFRTLEYFLRHSISLQSQASNDELVRPNFLVPNLDFRSGLHSDRPLEHKRPLRIRPTKSC